ncbi:MAG: serine protease [Bacteroidetes bacterium]|nr:MAG: serine protease [Bacteroidota bacterium]
MKYRILVFTFIISIFSSNLTFAGEGMWIPMLLKQLNEKQMKAMGMHISADDIYSVNHSSLKDAILLFGRGCTSEIISKDGLLLTNHHCGFSSIQKHSSLEHDYLTNGFWAMSKNEELVNPGLTATLMIRMDEVTDQVLAGVADEMSEQEREDKISENSQQIIKDFEAGSEYQAAIKSFFKGNQYYMIVTETFKDIRLVGTPPSNIGKFGGDTDNWMWPRHTGDFSLFRIYVSPDGKPAEYSEDNVPYQPMFYFPISLKGIDKGDFTFVFGYPARTNEYLPSYALKLITEIENPQKIKLRQTRLDIFNKYAASDPKIRIQYASKDARVANYWKKMIGESRGIKRLHGIEKKESFEKQFQQWADESPELQRDYGDLLPSFKTAYNQLQPLNLAYDYVREAGLAIELVNYSLHFEKLVEISQNKQSTPEEIKTETEKLQRYINSFFKDCYKPIDEEVMAAMLQLYDENREAAFKPDFFNTIHKKYHNDYTSFTHHVFDKSFLDDQNKVTAFLKDYQRKDYKKIVKDPAYQMSDEIINLYKNNIKQQRAAVNGTIDSLMRIYMKGQMDMLSGKTFYPDANFTLRVTYGDVDGYSPKDAVEYDYATTLEGIMEKENPDIYDYVVEEKLKELYNNKDYGQYAGADGKLHICFVASNHTTGGNSGSPVLNADGELIGVNFDRCWEGTMSDLMYDPDVCRNISLDIRYFLFIVDKFAGAGYLLDEMNIVK